MGLHGVAACLSRRNSDGIVTRIDRLRYQLRYRNKKDYVFYGLWDCMVVDMFRSGSETIEFSLRENIVTVALQARQQAGSIPARSTSGV